MVDWGRFAPHVTNDLGERKLWIADPRSLQPDS